MIAAQLGASVANGNIKPEALGLYRRSHQRKVIKKHKVRRPERYQWLLILTIMTMVCVGCGWQQKIAFESQSKRYRLEVYQPKLLQQSNMRIDLVSDRKQRATIYRVQHEIIMEFAHVYWSPDERRVGFLACGSGPVQFAYDLQKGQTIPFEQIAGELRRSIIQAYPPLPPHETIEPPFSPCDVGSFMREYDKRYPKGRTD